MSEHGIHASVTVFSQVARLMIPFSDHTNSSTFIEAVNQIDHGEFFSDTKTLEGLRVTLNEMFNESNGMRPPDIPKTLIIMTDGNCNLQNQWEDCYDSQIEYYRDRLKERGITVIAIGVGLVNSHQMRILVGDKGKYIQSLDFTQLTRTSFIRELSLCDVDCDWERWGSWSSCDSICGEGIRSRMREKRHEGRAKGEVCRIIDKTQEKSCYNEQCTSTASSTITTTLPELRSVCSYRTKIVS